MKERILELIREEDPKNPLTDDEIARKLGVFRETVTTMRKEEGILDSRERRRPVILSRMKELLETEPNLSDRGLTRKLEADGFTVGKYAVGKLREELLAEGFLRREPREGKTQVQELPPDGRSAGQDCRPAGQGGPGKARRLSEEDEVWPREGSGTRENPTGLLEQNADVFRAFVGWDGSLKNQISKAQASIMYPPKGLHCLIYGPSGVGKSYLAELMHSFACGTENFGENPPYFAFNCADYADNPQLLLAQLFGYNKGSFTGADRDRKGVVEMCNGGILFLDEVHRLPPEGQEILFYLMDKGRFRRLGEVDTQRESHLMVIAATTENPQSSLLLTFRRRIPMIIEIPPLKERPMQERMEFVRRFFWQESRQLGRSIVVKKEVLQCLMSGDYAGNVGQVKSDIQVCCAKAFLESKIRKTDSIEVSFDCLAETMKREYSRQEYSGKRMQLVQGDMYFYPEEKPANQEHVLLKSWDIYGRLENNYDQLVREGMDEEEINSRLSSEIEAQLSRNIRQIEKSRFSADEMKNIVGDNIMRMTEDIYELARKYFPGLARELLYPLAVHLKMALQRSERGVKVVPAGIHDFRERYKKEYEAAEQIYREISGKYYLTIQEEEISFLAMYLNRFREREQEGEEKISVLVVSHGAVACGMAEVANAVLGTDHAKGLEMNLMDSPSEMTEKVIQAASALDRGKGLVILADMGSLMQVGEKIKERLGIPVGLVGRTDTMMVIEAVRRTLWTDDTIEQIVEALDVKHTVVPRDVGKKWKKPAILCLCITGEGAARLLKEFIQERLKSCLNQVSIVVRGYIEASDVSQIIRKVEEEYEILAIAGTIDPEYGSYPFVSSAKLYQADGLSFLRKILKRRKLMEENNLSEVIDVSHIRVRSGSGYKDEILDEMVGGMIEEGYVSREFLLSVYKRESMMTTVLNGGIGIPHGNPEFVTKPVISVTKLDTPVVWDGVNMVDLIFMLALDEKSKKYFEQLYQIISDESMVSAIRGCTEAAQIEKIICKNTKTVR